MTRQSATAMACVVGMLFAPDNLILLGYMAGSMGVICIIPLLGGISVYMFHSRCYKNTVVNNRGATGEFEWIANVLGSAAAVIFSIGARVLSAVFLATATLVASGYVFNEVFIQRFPNFAFAFLMLGALLAINLYKRELSGKIQLFLSGMAVAGIFILAIIGIYQWFRASDVVYATTFTFPLKASFSVLLLFVGFDLLTLSRNQAVDDASSLQRHLRLGIGLAGVVLCLWGLASTLHIPSERLAGTTIPHILAAKKILGQPGRIVMGLVIIAGTGAAVNALFMAVGGMIADLSRQAILSFLPKFLKHSFATMVLLALVIAIVMALGVAGTDELDTYIRGSLILWLMNYALLNLSVLLAGARWTPKLQTPLSWRQTVPHGAVFLLMLTGSMILIATDNNPGLIIRYLCIIFFGIGLPIWVGGRIQSRRRKPYNLDGK